MGFLNLLFESKNPGRNKLNISKLINSPDTNDSIIKLDDYVCNLCEFGSKMELLSSPQKVFYCIQNLEREINNGGFRQFYFNSSGDLAHETYYALRVTGAVRTSDIVRRANDEFPGKIVPKDRSERQKVLEQIGDTANTTWNELEQRFLAYEEDLNALNLEFIRKNKNFF